MQKTLSVPQTIPEGVPRLPSWPKNYYEAEAWQDFPQLRRIYPGFYSRYDSAEGRLIAVGVLGKVSGTVICIGYHGPQEGEWVLIPEVEFYKAVKAIKEGDYAGPSYTLTEVATPQEILNCLHEERRFT